jgi:hypothetical protein
MKKRRKVKNPTRVRVPFSFSKFPKIFVKEQTQQSWRKSGKKSRQVKRALQ